MAVRGEQYEGGPDQVSRLEGFGGVDNHVTTAVAVFLAPLIQEYVQNPELADVSDEELANVIVQGLTRGSLSQENLQRYIAALRSEPIGEKDDPPVRATR